MYSIFKHLTSKQAMIFKSEPINHATSLFSQATKAKQIVSISGASLTTCPSS